MASTPSPNPDPDPNPDPSTGVPLLVLANKQDASGAATPHEIESRLALQQVRDVYH